MIQSIKIDGIIHSPSSDQLIICNDDKILFYKYKLNSDDLRYDGVISNFMACNSFI